MYFTGIDLLPISRMSDAGLTNHKFLDICFTKDEQTYCFSKHNPAEHFAARFAAKEATIKALSGLNLSLKYNEIEIIHGNNDRPYIKYHTDKAIFHSIKTDVSLSHSDTQAIAIVIITMDED